MSLQRPPVRTASTRSFTLRRRPALVGCLVVLGVLNLGNVGSVALGADTVASRYLLMPLEQNPSTWFASLLLGITAALAYAVGRGQADARYWTVVAALLVVMSIDEVAMLHERLGHLPAAPSVGGRPWVGVGLGIVGVVGVRLFPWLLALERTMRRAIMTGAALFSGAVGFEVLSGKRRASDGFDTMFWMLATIEENLEIVGVLVVAYALLGVLCGEGGGRCTIVISPTSTPRTAAPTEG